MQGYEEQEYTKKTAGPVWKRLFAYAGRHRGRLIFVVLIQLVVAAVDIAYPLMAKWAIDGLVPAGRPEQLIGFAGLYFLMVALQSVGVGLFISQAGRLEMAMAYDIREEGFQKLQELSMSFYDKTAVGYLLARMVGDIGRLSEMIAWAIVDLLWSGAFVLGCIAAMFLLNARLAAAVLLVIPVLAAVSAVFQKKILEWQRRVRRTNSRITGAFNEGILGAMTTKTLVREEKNFEEFSEVTGEMRRASIRSARLSALFMAIVIVVGSIGTAVAIERGGSMVLSGALTMGTLAAFIGFSRQLFEPIQQIARILAEMQTARASAERVLTLLDTPAEIKEKPEVVERFGDNFTPKTEHWPSVRGEIEFRDVSFRYSQGEPLLDHFNLTVPAGRTLAIVGETGAGKSTLVNLICRFYEPTAGEILIDGTDYRERSSLWLQKNLGYVLQTPHLFSGTIADNIRYGRRGATDREVMEAAKMVNAHDFITAQPKGYDTEVGEEGARLSTGQKQLISFARVILADPRIFVLDEATSSIDTETERMIQQAITGVLENRTGIIVAHRLSTVRSADRIVVMKDGGIAESGSHGQLMREKGYYYKLYTNQFMEQAVSDAIQRSQ